MEQNKEQQTPLQFLRGVGPRRAEALAASGLLFPADLLRFYPRAYIDRNTVSSLRALRDRLKHANNADLFSDDVNVYSETMVVAWVRSVRDHTFGKNRTMVVVTLDDGSGVSGEMVYWNQAQFFKKAFQADQFLAVSGRPEISNGKVQFHHPDVDRIDPEDEALLRDGSILPKYSFTQKMRDAGMTMRLMRQLVASVIDQELPTIEETLPNYIREKLDLPGRQEAIRQLHFPDSPNDLLRARNRMKFEELFFFEILLAMRHHGVKNEEHAIAFRSKSARARALVDTLPFELTGAQKRVVREIVDDMGREAPMNRLLQGDVGSGKTIVALLSMLVAIDNGCQCALMAPTEILAEQHLHTLSGLLHGTDIRIVQLVGGQKAKARREMLATIASGEAHIVVGTHAVFQKTVEYNKLGLVVIDEQHRFGVMQRAALRERATASFQSEDATPRDIMPHILVMSATPIPRTLSMTVYGDLDVSIIDELPKNRKPIDTKVVFENQLPTVYEFIREQVRAGRQAYIVYPLVEKSDKIDLKSAVEHYETLQHEIFPDLRLGLLHGQMFWYEKEDAMREFKEKKYDILVATTVVEVGIDVPNASVMLIENAERFGLSQLHQLRGRVGRGSEQSFCLLATKDHFRFQLSRREKEAGEQKATITRLKTMQETTDGFKIAEVDLQLRGPGDVLGTRQSGLPEFVFTNLVTDGATIRLAREEAFALVDTDPHLRKPEHEALRREFLRQYREDFGYLDVA